MELKINIEFDQLLELVSQLSPAELDNLLAFIEQKLKLEKEQKVGKKSRQYGFAKGMTTYVAPDFDDTPPGFEEYMPSEK